MRIKNLREDTLNETSLSLPSREKVHHPDEIRREYAFLLKQIRSVRASLVTPTLSVDSVEGRLTVCKLRIESALERFGTQFCNIDGYSESKLRAQFLKLEQNCYRDFVSRYLTLAEAKFNDLSSELKDIASASGHRFDGTDGTFANGVRYFRATIRCYQIACSKGVVFPEDKEIKLRLGELLGKVQGYLVPTIDSAVTLGLLSEESLSLAIGAADRGHSIPQLANLQDLKGQGSPQSAIGFKSQQGAS